MTTAMSINLPEVLSKQMQAYLYRLLAGCGRFGSAPGLSLYSLEVRFHVSLAFIP